METSLFNRRLRWTDAARLLDVGFESATLPALVTCPLCQGHTLRVYDDTPTKGAWFHCRACGRGGDCLSFTAAVLGVDVAGAVERFIAAGILPDSFREMVPTYVAGVAARQRRMDEFWAKAAKHMPLWESPAISKVTHALRVNTGLAVERWRPGMGTLVGAAPAREAELAFSPNVNMSAGGNPSSTRIFRGRGWSDVLVLPYHSAAGKISGFSFVGRGGLDRDRVFRPVMSCDVISRKDAGLYAPHAAEGHASVVAVRDDLFALKLHGKHFGTSGRFLNLIGWRDDGTHATGRSCWQQLNGKRVVHWVQAIDAAVIRQAFHFDADISTAGPDTYTHDGFQTYCRQVDPPDLMRRVVRQARPWRYALAEWVKEAHGGGVEVMARQLASYGIDPHEVARSLPDPEAADRLHDLTGAKRGQTGLRSVAYASGKVEARPDGWYYTTPTQNGGTKKRTARVTDFTITVRQIRVLPEGEVYDCDVYFQGRTHAVEIDPDVPIARQLIRAGVGVVMVAPAWAHRLLQVAVAFAQPPIVKAQ